MKNTDVAEPGRHYWLVRTTPISTRDGGGAHSTHFTSGPGRADPPVDPVLKEGETFHGAWECFQVITSGHQAAACWRRLVGPPLVVAANQPEPDPEEERPGTVLELVPGTGSADPRVTEEVLEWFQWHAFEKGPPVPRPRTTIQQALQPFSTRLDRLPPNAGGLPILNGELLAIELVGALLQGVEDLALVRSITVEPGGLPGRVLKLSVGASDAQPGLIVIEALAEGPLPPRTALGLTVFDARQLAHALLGAIASVRAGELERAREAVEAPPLHNPHLKDIPGMFDTKARAREAVAALGTPRVPDGTPDVPEEPKKPGHCAREGICPIFEIGDNKLGCSRCDAIAVRGSSWFAEAEPYMKHHIRRPGEE